MLTVPSEMRLTLIFSAAAVFVTFASVTNSTKGLDLPSPGIDPRVVGRISKMGSRPHVFFIRENQLIQIDVSTVVKRGNPARLAETAQALHRYAQIKFPLIEKAETDMRYPSTAPVKLHFKAFGFATFAILKRTPLAPIDGDGYTASWSLLETPAQRDFKVFAGSVYVKPLDHNTVYLRYIMNIHSKYNPPNWMMSLVFDNVGRKLARDAVRALVKASIAKEEEKENRRTYRP